MGALLGVCLGPGDDSVEDYRAEVAELSGVR
jgi:hypothetical protein